MYSTPNGVLTANGNANSITELLGALCDCSIHGVSWKRRAMGGLSKEGARKSLKKRAYGALLSKLFQPGTCKGSATGPATTPPRNKVLMISFDLRVAGCQEEAERLEELLGTLPEGEPSDPVLELLVHLAGSAAPPPTSFSRDYMRRERPVLRRPPLEGYQSKELQRLEARAWGLVCSEEWGSLGGLCGTLGLMDALPGTGLQALRMKLEVEERFEKDTRLTLFGALQHTRTSDLHIKLDLPPVPSDADVTGLAIKVPHCFDQSEDEGFQSASNLTPDSQSVPSPCPEFDIWEALGSFEPGKRRCWESVGCPPGNRELPYVTEGGREAFDQLYRLWEGQMRVVSTVETPSPILPLPLDSQTQLVSDLLNVLIGVESTTFPLSQSVQFNVRPGVCVSGTSPESMSRLLGELAQYGTHYMRLSHFSRQTATKRGLVFQAFTGGLRKYLHYYRACVLSTPPTLSLLTIGFHFRKVGRQLRYLSELCCVDGPSGVGRSTFPVGVKMLSYLYNEAQSNCSNENYPVLLSLLKSSCEPYTRFVSDWVYSGVFRDVHSEFMIQVNEDYLSFRDKHFWQRGYTLISKDVEDFVPVFLRHIANDVYVCGKTINLLKICCPQHYICWSELPTPRISVTFSLQEVEEIERDCAVYRGRVEMIAKHSATSREEQARRTEHARQELINQVRQSAAKTLDSIRGRQVSLRLVEEAKKRERFEELKQHLEQEQEWRSAARRKEQEDDFSFTRELRDREQRLQVLEEQLEQRARNELIAQYGRLSEDAARRERRALWRVQRMRLDPARAQFLTLDEEKIENILEKYPLGQERPPIGFLSAVSQTGKQRTALQQNQDSSEHLTVEGRELPDGVPVSDRPAAGSSPITEGGDVNDLLDQGLGELGSDLQQQPPAAVDYDFSAPFRPLEGITGQAPPPPAVLPDMAAVPHPSASHIAVGENVSDVQASFPRSSVHGQASASSFPTGQYTLEGGAPDAPKRSVHGHPSQSAVQLGGGDGARGGDNTPEPLRATTVQTSSLLAVGNTLEANQQPQMGTAPVPVEDTTASASGSSVEASSVQDGGGLQAERDPPPLAPSPSEPLVAAGQRQDSAAQFNVGEFDGIVPLPSQNPHGHASDSRLQAGALISDDAVPFPSPSTHGHASDSQLTVGARISDDAVPFPSPSAHGHSSDAHIQVGENISDSVALLPAPEAHGHTSDCTLQTGCVVSGTEPRPGSLPGGPQGHSSDPQLTAGALVSDNAVPLPSPSVQGLGSDTHIEVGANVVSGSVVSGSVVSGSVVSGSVVSGSVVSGSVVSGSVTPLPVPAAHASDAHVRVSDGLVAQVGAPLPSPSAHGHASDGHIQVGENVSDFVALLPTPGAHGHASDCILQTGCVVSGTEPATGSLPGSAHGHSSDSTLGGGCVVSGVDPAGAPLPGSTYGHASDSTLGDGCVVSGTAAQASPLPGSVYGHSSDSTLGVGCVVSGAADQASALPGSAFGHSSDSTLGVGCVVSGVETLPSPVPGSAFGHSSDSALGVGCVVSGTAAHAAPLPGSAFGHSSDSTLGVGCIVSGMATLSSPVPGSAFGHSSDSALGVGCVVSGTAPLASPIPGSAFGHTSDSTLGIGCVVSEAEPIPTLPTGNIHGHSSDSTLGIGCVVKGGVHGEPTGPHNDQGGRAALPGLSLGELSEQDYLLSLAVQYEVETYEDCSNRMSASPECQLLKRLAGGPRGLPADPTLQSATDTTSIQLSEMVSLPVLMKHSVTGPLITHMSLVNKAVVDYFFVELGVERHFEALRHFLLMEDGEFAQSLGDLLFEKLGSGQTPGELLTPLVLNSILSKALQYSLHGDIRQAANFTFALRFLPDTFHPHAPDSLNCLELRYKVDWPLNIIITDGCMNKYNRLFSFLLQLKHMVWSLRDVWFHLKRTALVKGAGHSVQFRQLQLYRHEMQHFVKVIQGYIANQILQVSWSEFTAKLATAGDLDAIHRMHADYLNRAIFRGLLTEKAAPVMNIIHSIFSLILKFRAQLIAQPWSSHQGETVHPSFIAMQQSYNTFKYYSHFLFKVVTKLVNRGYQPHLEDFLLRINFNNYYKET
ncbi:gamma-tubulin complex component 6 isoform X2 [Gadus macrocephalus]|uniref:gamma-tubulin complex component 6 isoform X2 n=1 Tax=Gadus macrocephalus TaxID=80720 RepID=UPI0028CB1D7D|nr:gamma-tubulin complex component 6 isoform X2 [Gadus macrocephalus]